MIFACLTKKFHNCHQSNLQQLHMETDEGKKVSFITICYIYKHHNCSMRDVFHYSDTVGDIVKKNDFF